MLTKDEIFTHFNFILEREFKTSLHARMAFAQYDPDDGNDYDFFTDSAVSIRYGATRGAIVDDEFGYVAKFDICGDNMYESGCDREMEIYADAVDAKLDKYFLEPQYIGRFRYEWDGYSFDDLIDTYGYQNYYDKDEDELRDLILNLEEKVEARHQSIVMDLYAYPYVSDFGYADFDIPHESKEYKISVSSSSPLSERYPSIGARFVRLYGEEEFNRLSEFLEWEEVNDLHNGNVAELNGGFVIVDYAGYHGD